MPQSTMTAHELNEALHAHFIRPDDRIDPAGAGAVYLTEVTAPGSNRRADAVHVGLWASRGAGRIDVCELKVSRADFRRELDDPAKAEAWWPYCSTFCIVAPSVDVAPPEELPPGWGLMVPGSRGRRFKTIVEPEVRKPELTIGLLITLLKNTETTRVNALAQQGRKLRGEFAEQRQELRRMQGFQNPEERRRLERLEALEAAMGMKLDKYPRDGQISPEGAARGLQAFMQGQAAMDRARIEADAAARVLEQAARIARQQAQALRDAIGDGRPAGREG